MADKGTKLFKIATQINIGRDAIVEYLVSKGFSIENKATAVLTDEMVDVVTDKFAKELKSAEKVREKVKRQAAASRVESEHDKCGASEHDHRGTHGHAMRGASTDGLFSVPPLEASGGSSVVSCQGACHRLPAANPRHVSCHCGTEVDGRSMQR